MAVAEKATRREPDMIGEYYADYSELTEEELSASDPDADALIARSRVVGVGKMNAPLNRDEQIEQMRTAKETYEKRMAKWLKDPIVRKAISEWPNG